MLREEYYGIRMFLPWHRAYLYRFEQALKDRNENVALPWWDWSSDMSHIEGMPSAFTSQHNENGDENPLFKTDITYPAEQPTGIFTERDPGLPEELPTKGTINGLMNLNEFSDFNDALENIHDAIHGWVGGSMGIVTVAAFDPIFWSHHCMIDRIWYLWQLQHGNSGMPANMYDMVLEPFDLKVRDVLNINDLGYEYAGSGAAIDF
jgi:tyrosinase